MFELPNMPEELKKLETIVTDMELAPKLRTQAIESIGNLKSYEALLTLLSLVANERLNFPERDLALKKAREVLKATQQ